jgi:ELWxxDGT repeat protein
MSLRRILMTIIAVLVLLTSSLPVSAQSNPPHTPYLVKDIKSDGSSNPISSIAEYKGRVYFFTFNSTDRYELWSSDGTDTGTSKVLSLNLDINFSVTSYEYQQANGLLFIILRDASSSSTLLWRTDGTAEGTWQIAKISQDWPEYAFEPVSYKDQLFFIQDINLWAINGNSHALFTSLLKFEPFFDKYKGPYVMNGLLYLLLGNQLWQSDGTAAGTQKVTTLEGFTQNYEFMPVCTGKLLYFVGKTSASGDELWVTDGSAAGTKMVSDLTSGTGSTQFKTHVQADGSLFFVTSKDQTQTLWITKGGSSDVQKLVEQASITMKGSSGNRAYFTVGDSSAKYSVWQSDGTSAGTKSLFNINYQYASLKILAKTIFFGNTDEASGNEIWVYDGSSSPRLLADIYPGADPTGYTRNSAMGIAAGKLWITADDGVHGRELWAYDILTSSLYLPDVTR